MKYTKTILILIFTAFLAPHPRAGESLEVVDSLNSATTTQVDSAGAAIVSQADQADSVVASETDSTGIDIASRTELRDSPSGSIVPDEPSNTGAIRTDLKRKLIYLVCAARYSSRASAEKHIESLKLFGYAPWIQVKASNVFLVVLAKTNERPKAEKMKSNYEKRGLLSFIEES